MSEWQFTRRKRKWGRTLRTVVVVSNILFWFVGCGILSLGVWMRFIQGPVKDYFLEYQDLRVALALILASGILFLVLSLVGTCGANMKNEVLLSLYTITMAILCTCEIISIFVFIAQKKEDLLQSFGNWYNTEVFMRLDQTKAPTVWQKNRKIVEHVQEALHCCGLQSDSDFQEYHVVSAKDAEQLRHTCIVKNAIRDGEIQRPEFYKNGCFNALIDEGEKFITYLWIISPIVIFNQLVALVSTILFVIYLIKGGKYDDDDEDCSALVDQLDTMSIKSFQDYSRKFQEGEQLPKPKVFRIVKKSRVPSFGIGLEYSEERKGVIVQSIEQDSNAEYAGLTINARIIEINGLVAQGSTIEEVKFKIDAALTEIKILVVEVKADSIYRECKVAVNLRNVEGVTGDENDYKPRLVKLERSDLNEGYGFNLLYLDDRKGEYIEEVTPRGFADRAGLKVGDRIIEVNGMNIETFKSREVVNQIRMSEFSVTMLLVDPKTDGYFRKKAVTITSSLAEEFFDERVGKVRKGKAKKDKAHIKPRYCRLVKAHKEDYGLYVVIDNNRIGQVVRWVDCGGPADRAGLRIGDRIIEVNGINCEYETHQRLVATIKAGKNICHFIVVDEDYDRQYKRGKPRLCRIFKEDGAFGFCVCYDDEKDGHYVEEVDPGGPAERAGLKTGDRVIQINGMNIEADDHEDCIQRLRMCEVEVLLLVTDAKADTHYKNIVDFKIKGMEQIDWDAISIPAEPYFMPLDSDAETEMQEDDTITLGMSDSISLSETKSFTTFTSEGTLRGDLQRSTHALGVPRNCTLLKTDHEQHGFFLAIDRDRNGQVIRRVEKGGPADAAGLRDGDRIIEVNGINCERYSHEQVVDLIKKSGNEIRFLVIDERSDDVKAKNKPYLFRIVQGKSGYGFYIWHDDDGHYVEDITIGSPADRAGLRAGDRIIEINNVNIEKESTEDVFYRIKACHNVVNLLAVDAKTFVYYKKNNIGITAYKADMKFSGWKGWGGFDRGGNAQGIDENSKTISAQSTFILSKDEDEDWGFKLANTTSFDTNEKKIGHNIHWVEKGGPAEYAGLRDGDRLLAVEDVDVTDYANEEVIALLEKASEACEVKLLVQYNESMDAYTPHDVEMVKKPGETFGFHLWFDDQGHYVEDVTIGSIADKAGLKVGDRVKEVNHRNIELEIHENCVSRVRESGDTVHLNVMSVQADQLREVVTPRRVLLTKEKGTFGFYINQDDKGHYFELVQAGLAADKAGVSTGDRLIEIGRVALEGQNHEYVVGKIKSAGESIEITILSTRKELPQMQADELLEDSPIFAQLLGKEKIDYKVAPRMFQNRRRRGKQEKRGTNFNTPSKAKAEGEGDAESADGDKNKLRKRKKKRDGKKVKFDAGEDNVAFTEIDEDEKKKRKKRRKKKEAAGEDKDKLSDDDEQKKQRRKRKQRRDEAVGDEEKIERHKALRKKTNAARKGLLMDGKKSSRKLEKTQAGDSKQKWDWEMETNQDTKLGAIAEEAEAEAPVGQLVDY